MKELKSILPKAALFLLLTTVICGVLYTGIVTALAQALFPEKANGSIIEVRGKQYGSALIAQQYTSEKHMWGRIMQLDVGTYTDEAGKRLLYAGPSNLSPASAEYAALVAQRVIKIRAAHPMQGETPIPVDLVTSSGSGLDPHITRAAAEYQVARLAAENQITEQDVRGMIDRCTTEKLFGLFGEEIVNVLQVNLMLDGIL